MRERGIRSGQFRLLYRVFLLRLVDLELLAKDADPTKLVGQFVTLFASVSFLFALPLLLMGGGRMPPESTWTVEHFLIGVTMMAAGVLTVLHWDAAFPDKRDLLVLGSLPVRASRLFLAKIAAFLAVPGLAMVGLNVFSGLVWPSLFGSGAGGLLGAARAWPAYWATVGAAGVFAVCGVLMLQGLAANVLPRQAFLRMSGLLQVGTLCCLVCVPLLEPSLESVETLRAAGNQALLRWLPSYWFLGVFQQLNGSMQPEFSALARRGWTGLAVVTAGAVASLLLGYYRLLPRTVEQPDLVPGRTWSRWVVRPRGSLAHALTLFSLRSLLRSRQHRVLLSFALGIGFAVLVQDAGWSPGGGGGGASETWLAGTLLAVMLPVVAIRVIAGLPVALGANWIFRVTEVRPVAAYRRGIRVSWLVLGVAPGVVLAVISAAVIASGVAVWHAGVLVTLGVALVEVCLRSFPKVPFACSYLPGKGRVHFVFWGCVVLAVRGLGLLAAWEGRFLERQQWAVGLVLVLAGAAGWMIVQTERQRGSGELRFEEEDEQELIALKLR